MDDRTMTTLRGEAELRGRRLAGVLDWPYDPFFRPLVGLYVQGRLAAITPTIRRAYGNDPRWRCYYSVDLEEDVQSEDVSLFCLETGERLYPARSMPLSRGAASVEDLIELSSGRAPAFDFGGFETFLTLPLSDQISIFYQDFLGHFSDSAGITSYVARIDRGALSILEARDEIAASAEARAQADRDSPGERRGSWCVWGGLDSVYAHLLPGSIGMGAVADGEPLSSQLAKIALGAESEEPMQAVWIEIHRDAIARMEARFSARSAAAAPRLSGRYSFSNLLPAIKCGVAGERTAQAVRGRRGTPGHVVYGPYMRLRPGEYVVKCAFGPKLTGDPDARLEIEAVHSDIMLAKHCVTAGDVSGTSYEIAFTLPDVDRRLLKDDGFEVRIWSDGESSPELREIAIDVSADAAAPVRAPSVNNWLALHIPGPIASRAQDTFVTRAEAGRVFYGPYCRIFPGTYTFAVTLDAFDMPAAGEVLILEAVGPKDDVLSRQRFKLQAGMNNVALSFAIPSAGAGRALLGPLEFRLDKTGASAIRCISATLTLES